jgi:hypothetical protein
MNAIETTRREREGFTSVKRFNITRFHRYLNLSRRFRVCSRLQQARFLDALRFELLEYPDRS